MMQNQIKQSVDRKDISVSIVMRKKEGDTNPFENRLQHGTTTNQKLISIQGKPCANRRRGAKKNIFRNFNIRDFLT